MTPPFNWLVRRETLLFAAIPLTAFIPLLLCRDSFAALFWFGDEWDQLDQIVRHGYWSWVVGAFGENFAPLFKLTWSAIVFGGQGSHFFALTAVFFVHAGCVAMLGRWMRDGGFSWPACAFAMSVLALAACNFETLGWSIQLLTLQGMLFFLATARCYTLQSASGTWDAAAYTRLGCWLALTTFSFVRGPMAGLVIAAAAVLDGLNGKCRSGWRHRLGVGGLGLGIATVAVTLMLHLAPGNHQRPGAGGWSGPAAFAGWYFLVNPFHRLFDVWLPGPRIYFVLGALKLLFLIQGWRLATSGQRRILLLLLLFEGGNSVLLGLGRYHTVTGDDWAIATTTSRYQYVSLITTLPFIAVCFERLLAGLNPRPHWQLAATLLCLTSAGWFVARNWTSTMQIWSEDRGRRSRALLLDQRESPPGAQVLGIDFVSVPRAKELIRRFNLH